MSDKVKEAASRLAIYDAIAKAAAALGPEELAYAVYWGIYHSAVRPSIGSQAPSFEDKFSKAFEGFVERDGKRPPIPAGVWISGGGS